MNNRGHFMIASLCFLSTGRFLFSQIVLQGTVRDNGAEYLGSGAEPVVNALVTVTDQSDVGRFFSAYTNEQGQYTIQITQTGVADDPSAAPGHFRLLQNYPNPFNPSTVICYELSLPCRVTIDIYNVLGRKIKTLLDGIQSGSGQVVWDATDANNQGVPAGLYIYSMKAGDVRINRKMLLIDGQQDNAPAAPVIQSGSAITGRVALNKRMSDKYILRVIGDDIAAYEQQNLEITVNTVLDITVIRTVTDIDGNVYRTVKIGSQWWMAENLKATHYRNGDEIPNMTGDADWSNLTAGACSYYDDNANNAAVYGRLYNWYGVNDSRKIAPAGWHVPSDEEWKELEMVLGMSQYSVDSTRYRGTNEGGKLKETGTSHWFDPNTGATNETGFSALPGGYRLSTVGYHDIGYYTYFWSSTEGSSGQAWYRLLSYRYSKVYRLSLSMHVGFSVRCVRDN